MSVKVKAFADFREILGKRELEAEAESLKKLLDSLMEREERLEDLIFSEEKTLRDNVTIMINGKNAKNLEGLETKLKDGDTVAISPFLPLSGG